MKYKIEELKDITDSREIMQSRPKGFSKYMTYIIIVILALVLIWSILADKQISIKGSGMVRPSDEVYKVSSGTMGNVTSLNIEEGKEVKGGDILVVINGDEYEVQKEVLGKSLERKTKELEANNKLKASILDGINKLDKNDEIEKDYYKRYTLYEENLKSGNSQLDSVEKQKEEVKKQNEDFKLLLKCYEEEKNYFGEDNYLYYQYKDYELTLNSYKNAISEAEKKIKELEDNKNQENESLLQGQIDEMKKSIISTKSQMEKYKNSQKSSVLSSIAQNEIKLKEGTPSNNNGNYKEQYIAQIDSNIAGLQSGINDIKMNLEVANTKLEATAIKAQCDGVITILTPVKVGDFVQGGTEIASIIPKGNETFNVEVYIENQNFGDIKEGDEVVLEFGGLPQREYGTLKSSLTNISVDSKINQNDGKSFYTAVCELPANYLTNRNGQKINIKNGMLVEVRIVSREVSYFRWFLEKINLLD